MRKSYNYEVIKKIVVRNSLDPDPDWDFWLDPKHLGEGLNVQLSPPLLFVSPRLAMLSSADVVYLLYTSTYHMYNMQ